MNWTKDELKLFKSLSDPDKIQGFLDMIDYNPVYECRSPRWVIREGKHIVLKEPYLLRQL